MVHSGWGTTFPRLWRRDVGVGGGALSSPTWKDWEEAVTY